MIKLYYSTNFIKERKKFVKANKYRVKAINKCLSLFIINPQHPSLNLEKLQNRNIWTLRIDKANRIFFIWISKDEALFTDIGTHDKYKLY